LGSFLCFFGALPMLAITPFDQIGIFEPSLALLDCILKTFIVFYGAGVITVGKLFAIPLEVFGADAVVNAINAAFQKAP